MGICSPDSVWDTAARAAEYLEDNFHEVLIAVERRIFLWVLREDKKFIVWMYTRSCGLKND